MKSTESSRLTADYTTTDPAVGPDRETCDVPIVLDVSKKWENQCALALWFAFYNFGRAHMTLKTETPAMASGLENHIWTIRELIEESANF
jgi:hypothetical protein